MPWQLTRLLQANSGKSTNAAAAQKNTARPSDRSKPETTHVHHEQQNKIIKKIGSTRRRQFFTIPVRIFAATFNRVICWQQAADGCKGAALSTFSSVLLLFSPLLGAVYQECGGQFVAKS